MFDEHHVLYKYVSSIKARRKYVVLDICVWDWEGTLHIQRICLDANFSLFNLFAVAARCVCVIELLIKERSSIYILYNILI